MKGCVTILTLISGSTPHPVTNNKIKNMAFVKFNPNRFRPDPKKVSLSKEKKVKIKPLSDKRKKQNDLYLQLRKVFLTKNKYCEVKLKGCTIHSTEVHHSEKKIGTKLTDIEFFVAICRTCHHKVENENIKFNLKK